ncbi:putative membrane protein [Paraburkholderia sp. GAS41]|jgi:uncharacterized membrane protein|uniref:TadG family pilus assembly protein n=1 Tax=Paraburkholderia sp. GAS41 TaxID=3035134 RepID=UPI003D1A1007
MSVSESSTSETRRFARRRRGTAGSPLRRQRGVTMVMAALCLAVAVAALGAIDVGNVFFVRRAMQRTADLAAAAGAQTVSNGGGCSSATTSAQQNAVTGNGLPSGATVTVVCGRWDPSVNAGQSYFATSGAPMNAVQVTVSQTVPYFFLGPARVVQAVGTAQATNIRSFSLTSAVATLSGGVLNGLLNALLPGANLNLSAVSYQGLATTQIKLGDLATALGVGSMSQLLGTQVSLSTLVSAMITAAGKSATLGATAITDLGTIQAAIPSGLNVALGNNSTTNGLLAVALSDPQAAASATVNLLDTLLAAAEIANGTSAINLGAALNLGALASVTAQAKVIQPPVIAVGEAGNNADGTPRTSAHSAQVQVYLNVKLLNLGIPGIVTISALNLPAYIEAAGGTAVLQSTSCTTQQATSQSTIVVAPLPATLCIGGDASSNFTNTTTAAQCNQPAQIANVNALGYTALSVSVGSSSGLNLQFKGSPTPLVFNGVPNSSTAYQSVNTNAVGSATAGLLTQVANSMGTNLHATVAGIDVTGLVAPLLSGIVTVLSPILSSLDALLIPVLQLLGVQIGVSTVHDLGLACGQAQLVY